MPDAAVDEILLETEQRLPKAFARIHERKHRLADYEYVQTNLRAADIVSDIIFQKTFTRFYKLRGSQAFRSHFFAVFAESKSEDLVSFDHVLARIHEGCRQVHPSFSSKIVASFDPHRPVYDSEVLKRLGLRTNHVSDPATRLRTASERYRKIIDFFDVAMAKTATTRMVGKFDCEFPEYVHFTPTKKLDLILWQARD